jgi:quercetin dioxygenase-like cupin family protein
MVLFFGADAPGLHEASMSTGRCHVAGEPIEDSFSPAISANVKTSVPFKQEAPDGLSLVSLDFPPGAMLPRHGHSTDCLYYIVSGAIVMGQRELGPGDGFFAPSDQPYAYRVDSRA